MTSTEAEPLAKAYEQGWRAAVTLGTPATVWTRQEGEMPGAPIYATAHLARQHTKADYAEALDIEEDTLVWVPTGNGGFEMYDDGEPTGWSLHEQAVITGEA